jgi:hypothetical protein
MIPVEDRVWCDVHGDVHAPVEQPYEGCPTEYRDGKPVWLMWTTFDKNGDEVNRSPVESLGDVEKMVPMEPDCTAVNWRKLWAGALVKG